MNRISYISVQLLICRIPNPMGWFGIKGRAQGRDSGRLQQMPVAWGEGKGHVSCPNNNTMWICRQRNPCRLLSFYLPCSRCMSQHNIIFSCEFAINNWVVEKFTKNEKLHVKDFFMHGVGLKWINDTLVAHTFYSLTRLVCDSQFLIYTCF